MASKKKTTKKTVKKSTKKTVKRTKPVPAKKVVSNSVVEETTKQPITPSQALPHSTKDNITRHDKFNSMVFIVGLLAVIVLLVIISPIGNLNFSSSNQNPGTTQGTNLLISFDKEQMSVGDTVSLMIDANNFVDLVGYEISLGFNSNVLKFKSLTYGNFLGEAEGKICVPYKNLGSTIDNIACIKLPSSPGANEGISGSGNLATLTFDVVGRGEVLLQTEDVKLLNSNKGSIDYQVIMPKIVVR